MKNLFVKMTKLTMAMVAVFSLASCGEEVNIEDPVAPGKDGLTVFSSVSDGTRTTIDNQAVFYWQSQQENGVVTRDQIWIDEAGTGTSFSLQSSSSQFESDKRTGKFYFSKSLSAATYKLSYTGLGSTTGDKVTISAEQQQSEWNNSDHIGTSGDCATATATKGTDGNYTFTLEHKSSYLIFKPYAPAATASNIYRLTEIIITDTDGNALTGTFPLKYDGLKTDGAENTANSVRLTCGTGFILPTAASTAATAYAVILPRDARNLRVAYKISSTSDGVFTVYENISGEYNANGARLISHELWVPVFPPEPIFISDGNGLFGGTKFKPAFLRRTDGNATTNATLELDNDPFILLQYDQGASNDAPTEFQRRMFLTWDELAEIFGYAPAGQGANWANTTATAANITSPVGIGKKQYKLPTLDQYSQLVATPNSGRATVNYYPASYAAVRVNLSADATYASKGWIHTGSSGNSLNANYIMGYLFFPDESVILDANILVASLNGRWGTTAADLTAADLREYINHGCMFLPAAGGANPNGWFYRGAAGYYWSGTIRSNTPTQAERFAINGSSLISSNDYRQRYFGVVLVEQ